MVFVKEIHCYVGLLTLNQVQHTIS